MCSAVARQKDSIIFLDTKVGIESSFVFEAVNCARVGRVDISIYIEQFNLL